MPLAVSCTVSQKVPITVATVPAGSVLDGALRLSVVTGDATAVQDATDPLKFWATAGALAGVSELRCDGDANPDPDPTTGVRLVGDTVTLTVTADEASGLVLTAGVAEPK